jgi:26S proteasome regulatory subunit N3
MLQYISGDKRPVYTGIFVVFEGIQPFCAIHGFVEHNVTPGGNLIDSFMATAELAVISTQHGEEEKRNLANEFNIHVELLKINGNRKLASKLARKLGSNRFAQDENLVAEGIKNLLAQFSPTGTVKELQALFQTETSGTLEALPILTTYLVLISCLYLNFKQLHEQVIHLATTFCNQTKLDSSLDPFLSKLFFILTQSSLALKREIQPFLLRYFTLCNIKHLYQTLQVIHNQIVRLYIDKRSFDQAAKFIELKPFPQDDILGLSDAGQIARHFYYLAQIKAVQMEYSEAEMCLEDSIRKIHVSTSSAGFLQTATKLLVTVQLLLGKVPERKIFSGKYVAKPLRAYLDVARSVRFGNIEAFVSSLKQHTKLFEEDRTLTFITRLHQNVVRAGLKRICVTYSRISLVELAKRLSLESVQDVRYIVLKAINDQVISNVTLAGDFLVRKEAIKNVYRSAIPHGQLNERIENCCQLLSQVQKAMNYKTEQSVQDDQGGIGRSKPSQEEEIEEFLEEEMEFY